MTETTVGDRDARSESAAAKRELERRGEQRYPAANVGFRSPQIEANLIDLSRDGLSIESLEHPPIGGTLAFTLERGKARVEVDGEVCWCSLRRTYRTVGGDIVAVYRAGIRLGQKRAALFDSITRAARLDWAAGGA